MQLCPYGTERTAPSRSSLVTSRTTGRWIIPKGWPSKRIKDYKAAAREARQEAGVKGKIKPKAIGSYRYVKPELGEGAPIDVAVYLLSVRKQVERLVREKHERRRAWFDVLDAACKIAEPELSALIGALRKLGKSAAKAKPEPVCA